MNKKLLTLDDLVMFCEQQKLKKFSSKETGYKLRVQVPATFELEESSSSTLFAYIQVCHTSRNKNGSNLTEAGAKECMESMAYKPLLANFCEIDGVKDFTSHDFTIDDDGNIEYQEYQIGCFTADKPYMKDDEKVKGRKNIFAKVAIPREYSDAAEIIERKGGTDVSAEIEINSMSYDSKEKELLIESAELIGCTCLGVNPETGVKVEPGMEGAHIQLEDFSAQNNTTLFQANDDLKRFIQASIKEAFDDINSQRKEENLVEFEENVEVAETSEEETVVEETAATEEAVEETVTEEFTEEETDAEAESEETEDDTPDENSEELNDNFATLSVTISGETKNFSVSLIEKLNALYTLVNDTYGESDNEWYDVDADEDAKEVYMHGLFTGKHWKQQYSVKKDVFSLKGDRVECYARYLTQDQIAQLDQMKANYAEISDKLSKYEAEPEKMDILNSEDYSSISESDEFVAFKAQDAHFDLSVDEVREKADAMLLNAAKQGKVEFAKSEDSEKKEIGMKKLPIQKDKKSGRYGSIFSK